MRRCATIGLAMLCGACSGAKPSASSGTSGSTSLIIAGGVTSGTAASSTGSSFSSTASSSSASSSSGAADVTDIGGNGFPGFADGPAGRFAVPELNNPDGVAVDAHGDVFIADTANNRIRRLDTTGALTTLAGNGNPAFADGSGGPDGGAEFRFPTGIAIDAEANLYVADFGTNRIRKIDPAGNVTTFAGSGQPGFADGTADSATFHGPTGVAVDDAGNLYVADSLNNSVRKVDAQGQVTTLAGNGHPGFADGRGGRDGGAELLAPNGVAVDGLGNVYVADTANERVRKVDPTGEVSTIAGNGRPGFIDGYGPDGGAELNGPSAVVVTSTGDLIVADYNNNRLRRIDAQGVVSTLAGNGQAGFADGDGPDGGAEFNTPYGLALDATGLIYVADSANQRIRRVDSAGLVTTLVGNGEPGFADGTPAPPPTAQLHSPTGIAVGDDGTVYFSDTANNRVRKLSGGEVTTVAGSGQAALMDGAGSSASFAAPTGLALDPAGNLYVADRDNDCIRQIDPSGNVTTLVATGLRGPNGVAVDTEGDLYIADTGNNRVLELSAGGSLATLAGNGTFGFRDGTGGANGTAELIYPYAVAVGPAGDVFVADYGNLRIRRIDPSGNVTTLAGNGMPGLVDGPPGTSELDFPEGLAVDRQGVIYIADSSNDAIRRLDPQGNLTTIAGTDIFGFEDGFGLPGGPAAFDFPVGVALDSGGRLYVTDTYNNCIRLLSW